MNKVDYDFRNWDHFRLIDILITYASLSWYYCFIVGT